MRLTTATFVAAGLVAGLGGASFAYQSATNAPAPVAAAAPGPTARPTQTVVRLLDCRSGWTLKHGICVRVVKHRVVVPAATGAVVGEYGPVAQRRHTTPVKKHHASKPGSGSAGHQTHSANSAGGSTAGSGGEPEDHAENEDPQDGPEVDDD